MSKFPTLFFSAIVPLIAGMCVATTSNAQSAMNDDAAYCRALSKNFFTNDGGTVMSGGGSSLPLEASVAISQCNENPESAIPVLEKVLRDNGIDLPQHS